MGIALIIIGLIMVVSAVRNTQDCLIHVVQGEFALQSGSYLYLAIAILILGAVGYSDTIRPVAVGLMVLILLSLFLKRGNQNLFQNLTSAIQPGSGAAATAGLGAVVSSFLGAL